MVRVAFDDESERVAIDCGVFCMCLLWLELLMLMLVRFVLFLWCLHAFDCGFKSCQWLR